MNKICLRWMTSECPTEEVNKWCLAGMNSENASVIYIVSSLDIESLWNKSKTWCDNYCPKM